jgi:RNase P subunit RPR2
MKHQKEKPKAICDLCGSMLNSAAELRVHMKRHAGKKDYLCTLCGAKFFCKFLSHST